MQRRRRRYDPRTPVKGRRLLEVGQVDIFRGYEGLQVGDTHFYSVRQVILVQCVANLKLTFLRKAWITPVLVSGKTRLIYDIYQSE